MARTGITGPYRETISNLLYNNNFEYAPAFTAPTTGSSRWIDGTAGGSSSISQYGWGMIKSGTASAQFDTTVKQSGTTSLKLSTASVSSYIEADVYNTIVTGNPTTYLIPALPSTSYTLSFWMKTEYISGDSSQGATVGLPEHNGVFAVVRDNTGAGAVLKTTTDWTYYSFSVTTLSTTRFLNVQPRIFGHTGTATLQMTAYFDDITLTPTTPTTRTVNTGPYRRTVENLVANGDFEYAPAFTAANTSFPVWIDGTASGSSFSRTYNWGTINKTGSGQAQFDNTQSYSRTYSLKVSTTATGSLFRCTNTLTGKDFVDCAVLPSTSYTISYCMKTTANSGSATSGAGLDAREWNGAGVVGATNVIGTPVTTTTDWTKYSATFTTASTARFIQIRPQVIGNDGTGTLIMDAWFDDIKLTTTAPYRNRKSIDNLVENGDFESVPTFTAATNTANRYIDGTAAGLNATEFPYRWFTPASFANATAQYDTSVELTGTASMKLSTTTTAGLASAIIGNNTSAANIKQTMIPVLPSTSYTVSGYCKTNNVAAAAAHIDTYEYDGAGTLGATNTTNTLTGTNDWTLVTVTFTTASTARYLTLALRNHVAGNVSDAWFDDIKLTA